MDGGFRISMAQPISAAAAEEEEEEAAAALAALAALGAAPAAPSSSARLMFASPGPANGAVPEQE